jgi:hypothetical protein
MPGKSRTSAFLALAACLFSMPVLNASAFPLTATVAASDVDLARAPWEPPPRAAAPFDATIERYPGTMDVSTMPAQSAVEHAQALNGTSYTVLSPIFDGHDNNYSFIRFGNIGAAGSATFYITVVGSPTGRNYGTATVTVAQYASPQYSISDILKAINVTGYASGDTSYSLYLQSPQAGQAVGFQHVVWNSLTGFFENASLCTYRANLDYSPLNQIAINVHTTQIPAYPGVVFMHNYLGQSVSYKGNVFDARNGSYLGAFTFTLPANSSTSFDMATLQSTIGFVPSSSQYHVNILYQTTNTATYYGVAATAINNLQLNAYTNMSVACGVNP